MRRLPPISLLLLLVAAVAAVLVSVAPAPALAQFKASGWAPGEAKGEGEMMWQQSFW